MKPPLITKRQFWTTLASLVAIIVLYILIGCIDSAEKEYPEFALDEQVELPEGENGILFLAEMPKFEYEDYEAWVNILNADDESGVFHVDHQFDKAFWDAFEEENQKYIEQTKLGMLMDLSFPTTNFDSSQAPQSISFIHLSRYIVASAAIALNQEEYSETIDSITLLKNFTFRASQKANTLVDLLVIIAIDASTNQIINALLNRPLENKELLVLKTILQQTNIHHFKKLFARCLKYEFHYARYHLNNGLSDEDIQPLGVHGNETYLLFLYNPFCFHPNRTIALLAENYRSWLQADQMNILQIQDLIDHSIEIHTPKYPVYIDAAIPNFTGRAIMRQNHIILRQAIRIHQSQVQEDLLLLKTASLLYQKEHGTLPKNIQQIETIVDKNLIDPYAPIPNTPYRYNADKAFAWSVGENYINDGGLQDSGFLFEEQWGTGTNTDFILRLLPSTRVDK